MAAIAAAGAKGAAGSSMKITGTMDTANIDRGFSRVNQGFEQTKGQAKSFGSDMQRVARTVSGLAKKLMFMGLAGATAMVGIASKAPAVAPALAKMQVEFGKMTRSLGEALAPAFERVVEWLEKLAVWVDNNKEKIGEIAMKFLDWAEKVGNWAMDNPGLFAGIVAGLALGPSILGGIAAVSGLVALLTGATVAGSLLTALGYIALIGGASYVAYKGATWAVDKAQKYAGMGTDPNAPTDMSGQTLLSRLPQKIWADIRGKPAPWEDPFNPNSPAMLEEIKRTAPQRMAMYDQYPETRPMMSAAPIQDRRMWLLQWWDSVWG